MTRLFYKLIIAFWTNLLGLLVVQSLLEPEPRHAAFVPPSYDADTWRPALTGMKAPGLVEGSSGFEHPLSPFGLRALVTNDPYDTNLQPIWDWYGIKSALPSRCAGCTAHVFQLELDDAPGVETVLRIGNQSRYQYLFFKSSSDRREPSGWKFAGYVDDISYRYEAPPHFTVLAGARRQWLVVQERGPLEEAGVVYRNRVFEVTPRGVSEVLTYPSSGYYAGAAGVPERSFDTLLLEVEYGQREQTVRVQFNSHYYGGGGDRVMGRQQQAVFARRAGADSFRLDPRRSDLSREEFAAVYGSSALGADDFLKYNYEELVRVASGDDPAAREWLRNLVGLQGPSQRAQALARLLKP